MFRTPLLLAVSLAVITSAQTAGTASKLKERPAALEKKLHGAWESGRDCVGDLTLRADGTFERIGYSPGNNKLTGTWEMRWNALPPTLVLTCKASDEGDGFSVGKTTEVKVIQLDDEALSLAYADPMAEGGPPIRYTRVEKTEARELAALQGVWTPLQYEEGGEKAQGEITTRHIIKGDRLTVKVDGETVAEGKVIVDPTTNPKHLDFQLTSGQTHLIVYVRVGDSIIYCGNRDGKIRPTEFVSGTAKGGEYLIAWKIQR